MKAIFLFSIFMGFNVISFAQVSSMEVNTELAKVISISDPVSKETEKSGIASSMAEMQYSLIGNAFYANDGVTIPNWNYDIDFKYAGKSGNNFYYTIPRQLLLANGEFKVRVNHDWVEPSFGYTELTIDSPDGFGWVGFNIKALYRRVYDITFIVDSLNKKYTLSLQYSSPLKREAVIKKASSAPLVDGSADALWAEANTYNIDIPYLSNGPTLGTPGSTTWKGLWDDNGIYTNTGE